MDTPEVSLVATQGEGSFARADAAIKYKYSYVHSTVHTTSSGKGTFPPCCVLASPDIRGSGEHPVEETLRCHPANWQYCPPSHSVVVLVIHSSGQTKVCYLDTKTSTDWGKE